MLNNTTLAMMCRRDCPHGLPIPAVTLVDSADCLAIEEFQHEQKAGSRPDTVCSRACECFLTPLWGQAKRAKQVCHQEITGPGREANSCTGYMGHPFLHQEHMGVHEEQGGGFSCREGCSSSLLPVAASAEQEARLSPQHGPP